MQFEPRDQFEQRQKKLQQIETLGHDAYPREFRWTDTAAALVERYGQTPGSELEANKREVRVAGRIVSLRLMGKAGFAHLQGSGKRIQVYVKKDVVGERGFELFHLLDPRQVFVTRARIIQELRQFFDGRGYIEVETPMMHPIPGGAAARPFITHHNTLDIDLYLRIAPELYLKRLTVGGFDRVYEINRNFRNEGISTQHNPEFTMLEFYEAYSNYRDLMDMNEKLFALLAKNITGSTTVKYGETELDFSRLRRFTMREAIQEFWPESAGERPSLGDFESDQALCARLQGAVNEIQIRHDNAGPWAEPAELAKLRVLKATFSEILRDSTQKGKPRGVTIASIFETLAEEHLIQPTIIHEFPTDISPLSKQKPNDPSVTERFEIYVAGMEVANGFSELNDPAEQERRFLAQIAQGGDEMPKQLDLDYIRALCHGMPPTAGEGIGIDRLTMLLTDSQSIRDVILFPLLRPEGGGESSSTSEAHGV